jgi:hypothetical protein
MAQETIMEAIQSKVYLKGSIPATLADLPKYSVNLDPYAPVRLEYKDVSHSHKVNSVFSFVPSLATRAKRAH